MLVMPHLGIFNHLNRLPQRNIEKQRFTSLEVGREAPQPAQFDGPSKFLAILRRMVQNE